MNRAAKRARLFECNDDYRVIERLLLAAKIATDMRLLAYCIMPNHWHLVLWPAAGKQMSQFMRRFTGVHAQHWQLSRCTIGSGAVYQGRYKAIPVQTGEHFYTLCRYVERNALRAGLVAKAEDWAWSSLSKRLHHTESDLLDSWPVPCPPAWLEELNREVAAEDVERVRTAIQRGIPLGDPAWVEQTAMIVGLSNRLRGRGRPQREVLARKYTRPLSL
jgi:putative transposase